MVVARTKRTGIGLAVAITITLLVASVPSGTHYDFSRMDAGFMPSESIDGYITKEAMSMWADQEFFSWTRGDFTIFASGNGHDDDLIYTVKGAVVSFHNRMTIYDARHRRVAVVQKYPAGI